MFRRQLSDNLVNALNLAPFWTQIIADGELHPEIRDNKVTVYYSGCAIMRELNLKHEQLTCTVNLRHVPFTTNGQVRLASTMDRGLQFDVTPQAMPLGFGTSNVISAYKVAAKVTPEKRMLGAVLKHPSNEGVFVDQEIAFSGNERNDDRIDLCYFDCGLEKLAFVEIKRVDDKRLQTCGGSPPEVLTQLQNYSTRFVTEGPEILQAYRHTIDLKRRLGLFARVSKIPDQSPRELLKRPILAIGGCSDQTVRDILNAEGSWKPLVEGLPAVAAGLHLFGGDGFKLGLNPSRQTKVWGEG